MKINPELVEPSLWLVFLVLYMTAYFMWRLQ